MLLFRLAALLRFLPSQNGAGSVIYRLELLNALVWIAWSVVLIGLFVFWKSLPALGDRHRSSG